MHQKGFQPGCLKMWKFVAALVISLPFTQNGSLAREPLASLLERNGLDPMKIISGRRTSLASNADNLLLRDSMVYTPSNAIFNNLESGVSQGRSFFPDDEDHPYTSEHEQSNVCVTPECFQAGQISNQNLQNLDNDNCSLKNDKFNPCDDFYEHACGKWINRNPIPPSRFSTSVAQGVSTRLANRLRGNRNARMLKKLIIEF